MPSRWIGWILVGCALAVSVDAAAARRPRAAPARPEAAEAAEAAGQRARPAKAINRDRPRRAGPSRRVDRRRPIARDRRGEPGRRSEPAQKDDLALARLADDPALGRADRVDGKGAPGRVAFTFDDGPNADTTPAVLDALAKYGVPGTFFVVTRQLAGRRGAANRAVLERIVAGGHTIGSHTVGHANLRRVSTARIRQEIDGSLRTLATQAGRPIGLFRPPYGALGERGRRHLQRRGLTDVRWSIDPADWRADSLDELRARTLATILQQDGGVVLMHDAKETTARSLALLLDDLEAANCQRLAGHQEPILPVSIHYWLRDDGAPRPIPDEVARRTRAYREALPARCAARGADPRESPR